MCQVFTDVVIRSQIQRLIQTQAATDMRPKMGEESRKRLKNKNKRIKTGSEGKVYDMRGPKISDQWEALGNRIYFKPGNRLKVLAF